MIFSWFLNVVVDYENFINPKLIVSEALSHIDINQTDVITLYDSNTATRLEFINPKWWYKLEKNSSFLQCFMLKKYVDYLTIFDISQDKPFSPETIRMEDVCYEGLHAMSKIHFGETVSENTNDNAASCPICYEKREEQLMLNCGHFVCGVCSHKLLYRKTCPMCLKNIHYSKRIFFSV